jgi:hypothetical protein
MRDALGGYCGGGDVVIGSCERCNYIDDLIRMRWLDDGG